MTNMMDIARQGRATALARIGDSASRARAIGAGPVTFSSVRAGR